MADPSAGYTFVPWFRRGAATHISAVDDPAAPAAGRPQVLVELELEVASLADGPPAPAPVVSHPVEVVGPADVLGLREDAVLRVHPPRDHHDASPDQLAYVEFYDEDLPWRHTPARAADGPTAMSRAGRLRPWLALLVLRHDEFTLHTPADGPPVLTVAASAPLPPADQAWAWAHAQLAGAPAAAAEAGQRAQDRPEAALSRLLSPRRLRSGVAYGAFVVPAFEGGRRAGLGQDTAAVPAQRPSWGAGQSDRRFPVYHSWAFATGVDGTFESYARRLRAQVGGASSGARPMDVSAPGYGADAAGLAEPVGLEGALCPPDFDRRRAAYPDSPGPSLVGVLEHLVDLGSDLLDRATGVPADPIVAPPAYGLAHLDADRVRDLDDDGPGSWVRELNLDPRQRAVAGLGAQVVADRQDEFVARAWEQADRVREANQRLREAEAALAVGEAMHAKHLQDLGDERLLLLASAALPGLVAPAPAAPGPALAGPARARSIHAEVDASRVPTATADPAFTQLTRPGRPLVRTAVGRLDVLGFQDGLLAGMNAADPRSALSAAPRLPAPAGSVALAAVRAVAAAGVAQIGRHDHEPKRVLLTLAADALAGKVGPDGALALPDAAGLRTELTAALATWAAAHRQPAALTAQTQALINAVTAVGGDVNGVALAVDALPFAAQFGKNVSSKSYKGVTAVSTAPPPGGKAARMSDAQAAADTAKGVSDLADDLASRLAAAPPDRPQLTDLAAVAFAARAQLAPTAAVPKRVAAALPALAAHLAAELTRTQRIRPAMAYPTFPDPMVEALQALAREHVLPGIGELPADSVTLMRPNGRFVEAFLAGLNTELGRELLWREYPTDQRGSYFRVFWDRADRAGGAGQAPALDVRELADWTGALGSHGLAGAAPLVLVVRSDLLRVYPHPLVYAQPARWEGPALPGRRTLDLAAPAVEPVFRAALDVDIALYGFELSEEAVRGHLPTGPADPAPAAPGWFFVFAERPGQTRFGLDSQAPAGGLVGWEDLSWDRLAASETYLDIAANATLSPSGPSVGAWGVTAADMAAILMRSPVMYARHADDLLPPQA